MHVVYAACGHVVAACWVEGNEEGAAEFKRRKLAAGERMETIERYRADPCPEWCFSGCSRRAKPVGAEGVTPWSGLRLAAEVAQEDGPWEPGIGMTNCEKAFAQSAGPATVLQMIDALEAAEAERDQLRAQVEALQKDKTRLDAIEQECWDVRFLSSPNGDAGDSSISIEIVGHFMAEPCERVVGENYNENLRAALDQAMTAEAYPPARPEYDERGRPVRAMAAAETGNG